MVVFTSDLKDFDLDFTLLPTTMSHLEVLKEHLQDTYYEYKVNVTATSKLILVAHSTRLQDIMDLFQSPQSPLTLDKNISSDIKAI